MRAYWLHRTERWLRLADTFAGYGNESRTADALAHLDDALKEALR